MLQIAVSLWLRFGHDGEMFIVLTLILEVVNDDVFIFGGVVLGISLINSTSSPVVEFSAGLLFIEF